MGFPGGTVVKNLPANAEMQETWVQFLGWENLLEEEMATHSSILVWRIQWTEEPGGLQFTESQRSDMSEHTAHTQAALQQCPACRRYLRRQCYPFSVDLNMCA